MKTQIEKTELVQIKSLKIGDVVWFYGEHYEITETPIDYGPGIHGNVFVAPCKIIGSDEHLKSIDCTLREWDGFQGNDMARVAKII